MRPIKKETALASNALSLEKTERKKEAFSEATIQETKTLERLLDIDYGFLPEKHDVTIYLNQRIKELFPEETLTIKVTDREYEPNALSLATGTIIVTRGLLETLSTQDEVDFVLAHEAIHYVYRHIDIIQDSLNDLKERIQYPSKDAIGQGLRLIGEKRFSEWEADLRALIEATKGKINPAAARSALLKLEAHSKEITGVQNKRDQEHGGLIDRVVNIDALSQMVDYESTNKPQQAYPESVQQYLKTPHQPWLFERFINVSTEKAREIARELPCGTLLLVLRRMESTTAMGNVRKKFTKEALLEIVQQKIQEECAENDEDAAFVMHQLLETVVGIRTDEAEKTEYEEYMKSIDLPETEEELREKLRVLDTETVERLGVVIPQFGDVVHFITALLSAANTNDVFSKKKGGLDEKRYVQFCMDITNHFSATMAENGFRPIDPSMVTQPAIEQALLNLDLRKSHQPLMDLLRALKEVGIPLQRETVQDSLLELPRGVKVSTSEYEQYLTVAEGENVQASRIIYTALEYAEENDVSFSSSEEFIPHCEQLIEMCTSLEDMHTVFITLNSIAERMLQRIKRHNEPEEVVKAKIHLEMVHIVEYVLAEQLLTASVEWLPEAATERYGITLALMRASGKTMANEQVLMSLGHTREHLIDSRLCSPAELVEVYPQYGAILAGTHPIYERLGWKPKSFRPTRLLTYTKDFIDDFAFVGQDLARGVITDSVVLGEFIQYYYNLFHQSIEDTSIDIDAAIQQFDQFAEFVFTHIDRLPTAAIKTIFTQSGGTILTPLFLARDIDITTERDQKLALYCSQMMQDPKSAQLLQEIVMQQVVQGKSFDEKLYWLLKNPITRFAMTQSARQDFIEHDVQTHGQFAEVRQELKGSIDTAADKEHVGAAVLLEDFLGKHGTPRTAFQLLFEMHTSDKKIKIDLFHKMRNASYAEDTSKNERAIVATDRALADLQRANDIVRYGVVRELLIGEDGLLHTQRDREWLIDYVFKKSLQKTQTPEQQQTESIVYEMVRSIVHTAPEDMLFFALAPLIHERIMRSSQNPASWEAILTKELGIKELSAVKDMLIDAENIRERAGDWKALIKEGIKQTSAIGSEPSATQLMKAREEAGANEPRFCKDKVEAIAAKNPLPAQTEKIPSTLTIERLVVKLAESLGSPGVRFVQILGQYVDVPPELQSAFDDATDAVAGQNKFTAYETMQREWPECEQYVKRVIERIGGGSLMSVYLCEMQNGSEEVVKVLAPNAKMKAKITIDLLRKSFTDLAKAQPDRYRIALAVIDEIEEWIMQDIDYDKFIERDTAFREKHNNFTAEGLEYSIYIPQSKPLQEGGPDNVYIKREERVEGKTLTRLKEEDGFDKKQIAALLITNYMQQIMDGQVHADVHPGNFMAFVDAEGRKRIAIIDRNNYIELNDADKNLLTTLQMGAAFGQADQLAPAIRQYMEQETGNPIADEQFIRIQEKVESRIASATSIKDIGKAISVAFHQEGIRIPLKITLLIKNINGLDRIARDAGFTSLQEAFGYTPSA